MTKPHIYFALGVFSFAALGAVFYEGSAPTTVDQDAFLSELNAESNPDGKTPVEDFAPSYLLDKLSEEVAAHVRLKVQEASDKLQSLPTISRELIFAAIDAEKAKQP